MKYLILTLSILTLWVCSQVSAHKPLIPAMLRPATVEAAQVAAEPQFVRVPHEDQATICKHALTGEHYRGLLVTAEETLAVLKEAGFNDEQARILTAISHAESGSDLYCWGDETLQNGTWRESYGLFQIRMLKNPGGSCRNYDQLRDDLSAQARCAKQIFDGQGYRAWTMYTNGKYVKWLDKKW